MIFAKASFFILKFEAVNEGATRLFVSLVFAVLFSISAQAQVAEKGKADISGYDIKAESPLYLYGTWEFYWSRLLTPKDFSADQNPEWMYVPGSWHRQGNYPVLGFATYRLVVTLPADHEGLSIYFPVVNSAARIWLNGTLAAEVGKVSASPHQHLPKMDGAVLSLADSTQQLEIVVQISNYSYFSGGFPRTPQIDRTSVIFSRMNRTHGIENFFAGSLVAMFIYQVILFFLYHRGKPYLWLALICLGVALRSLIVHGGSFLLPNLLPDIHWEYWKKIEFGSVYAISALFPLYVYHLFRGHAPKLPMYFFVMLSSILCAIVFVTPQYTYGRLLDVSHIALLLGFIYAVYSISRAWRAGNEDARIILFGVLASFPFILGEILQNTELLTVNINFMYLVEMGVLVFLLFQVYLLANHYAKSYRNLEVMNVNLEKMVEERTGELRTANTVKDRLLSVVSHDIKSPLNLLLGILQTYNKGAISKEEFDHFAQHVETDLNKTTILVENILYWTTSQLKGMKISSEDFDLFHVVDENIQLFYTVASNKKISIAHNIPKNFVISTDRDIINLVLRNLIANALKFSYEGGVITISASKTKSFFSISVRDQGVGMDKDTVQHLTEPNQNLSTSGTKNESGTGLGLALCREYLQQAGGQLTIESAKDKGSVFTILIPVK